MQGGVSNRYQRQPQQSPGGPREAGAAQRQEAIPLPGSLELRVFCACTGVLQACVALHVLGAASLLVAVVVAIAIASVSHAAVSVRWASERRRSVAGGVPAGGRFSSDSRSSRVGQQQLSYGGGGGGGARGVNGARPKVSIRAAVGGGAHGSRLTPTRVGRSAYDGRSRGNGEVRPADDSQADAIKGGGGRVSDGGVCLAGSDARRWLMITMWAELAVGMALSSAYAFVGVGPGFTRITRHLAATAAVVEAAASLALPPLLAACATAWASAM